MTPKTKRFAWKWNCARMYTRERRLYAVRILRVHSARVRQGAILGSVRAQDAYELFLGRAAARAQ
jgi:hypothetical protein